MEEKNNFKHSLKFTTHDISTQQKEMKQFFHGLNDKYLDANSLESKEYFSYLASAIYLTCKDLYPDLSIYIPFRIKSDNSTQKNYPKEFHSGITEKYNSQENELDLTELVKDFLAATVVLDHVKNSRKTNVEYVSNNIDEYRKLKEEILDFVNDADEELNDFIDEKKYIELKMKTLELLSKSTYPECSNERTITYDTERKEVKKSYDIKSKTDDFMPYITEDQVKNLKNLLLDLRSRSSDKLEFEILKEILPNVFNAPLIKNALKVDFKFEKEVKKPNGFVAIYYTLSTPFGIIEIQSQSNKRYYESKKGSAFHSGILGKEVDITSFFELVDENDNRPLNFYLSKLDLYISRFHKL